MIGCSTLYSCCNHCIKYANILLNVCKFIQINASHTAIYIECFMYNYHLLLYKVIRVVARQILDSLSIYFVIKIPLSVKFAKNKIDIGVILL